MANFQALGKTPSLSFKMMSTLLSSGRVDRIYSWRCGNLKRRYYTGGIIGLHWLAKLLLQILLLRWKSKIIFPSSKIGGILVSFLLLTKRLKAVQRFFEPVSQLLSFMIDILDSSNEVPIVRISAPENPFPMNSDVSFYSSFYFTSDPGCIFVIASDDFI